MRGIVFFGNREMLVSCIHVEEFLLYKRSQAIKPSQKGRRESFLAVCCVRHTLYSFNQFHVQSQNQIKNFNLKIRDSHNWNRHDLMYSYVISELQCFTDNGKCHFFQNFGT